MAKDKMGHYCLRFKCREPRTDVDNLVKQWRRHCRKDERKKNQMVTSERASVAEPREFVQQLCWVQRSALACDRVESKNISPCDGTERKRGGSGCGARHVVSRRCESGRSYFGGSNRLSAIPSPAVFTECGFCMGKRNARSRIAFLMGVDTNEKIMK